MNIEKILQDSIQAALLAEFEVSEPTIALQPTRKDFEGFYTFVVFPYVKALRKSPVEIGNAIGNYLVNNTTVVSTFNVVQGFLNISIADCVVFVLAKIATARPRLCEACVYGPIHHCCQIGRDLHQQPQQTRANIFLRQGGIRDLRQLAPFGPIPV